MTEYAAVEGRTGTTNYRASFTYQDNQGVMPDWNNGAQLKGFRLNIDHEVRHSLNIGLSTYYAKSDQEDMGGSPFYALAFQNPFVNLLATGSHHHRATALSGKRVSGERARSVQPGREPALLPGDAEEYRRPEPFPGWRKHDLVAPDAGSSWKATSPWTAPTISSRTSLPRATRPSSPSAPGP